MLSIQKKFYSEGELLTWQRNYLKRISKMPSYYNYDYPVTWNGDFDPVFINFKHTQEVALK